MNLNVRDGPGVDYPVVDWLLQGNFVLFEARTEDGSWLRVAQYQTARVGWVVAAKITAAENIQRLPVTNKATPTKKP
jgi:uncharacterized protein YraI